MTEINIDELIFFSNFSGLGNNQNSQFSVDIPSQTIAAFFGIIYTAVAPLDNEGSIPNIQIRYKGLTDWISLNGDYIYTDPGFNYTVTTSAYFTNNILTVSNFLINSTAGSLNLTGFTVECDAALYSAPF